MASWDFSAKYRLRRPIGSFGRLEFGLPRVRYPFRGIENLQRDQVPARHN